VSKCVRLIPEKAEWILFSNVDQYAT